MTALDLLARLRAIDAEVWVEEGRLRCRVPPAAVTPELQAELALHRHELLTLLTAEVNGEDSGRICPIGNNGEPAPLSPAQEQLWFLAQLEPASAAYHIAGAVRLTGALDVLALARAVREVVRRHDTLRTRFTEVDGQPLQVVDLPDRDLLDVVDLRDLTPANRQAALARRLREEAQRPFDLARGPLLRVTLVQTEDAVHVLCVVVHHIVADGWSIGIFVHDLQTLYRSFSAGQPSPLPELPLQYADYAHWQRQRLQGEVLARQLAYWRHTLAGAPLVLELHVARARPPAQIFQGARERLALGPVLTEGLNELSRRLHATLYMILLAAFQALVGRYSGLEDFVIGSPIAGRIRPELEGLVGFFINTLPLRADLSGEPSFRELLRRTRERCLEAYAHQDVPFAKLVEELRPPRDRSRNALVQVVFALQNMPMTPLELPGLTWEPEETETGATRFDLSLALWQGPRGLEGRIDYSTDLFDAPTIERFARHFSHLLEEVVADPEQPVGTLPLLDAAERDLLLDHWNATDRDYPRDVCLHELFEAQVERTPDAIAVRSGGQALTYRELDARAARLADYLRGLGVGPDRLVAVCLERSVDLLVGLLGILKAGGAYVPLDPLHPHDRLAFVLEDSTPLALLTQACLVPILPAFRGPRICIDADWASIASGPPRKPSAAVSSRDLMYVLYTSGSTGRPKGACIEHRSAVNYLFAVNEVFADAGRLPVVTSLTFDASLKQLFAPLLRGDDVWILPDDVARDPDKLLETLADARGVGLNCVPSLWMAMVEQLETGGRRLPDGSLVSLLLGGDQFDADLLRRSRAAVPGVRVWNLYGPTEATATAATAEIGPDNDVTIGRPLPNMRLYILDRYRQPVPVGLPGELYIGGIGVARGYLNRVELTAERFVPDPFEPARGPVYRTGDMARFRTDGRIEFLGRVDTQVKIRGIRIELGEIEAVLSAQPGVREAAVVVRQASPGDTRLVAYVVLTDGATVGTVALRRELRARLPEYMVPASFLVMTAMPRTPSGKVDRRALPVLADVNGDVDEHDGPRLMPRTPIEQTIASIWSKILGVESIGVDDNFFNLGGHSLLATQAMSRLRSALHVEVPLRAFFEASTLGELAELVEARRRDGAAADALPLVPVDRTGPLALSFQQERLWFFDQLEPGSATFNVSLRLRLAGPLDLAALQRTLEAIWARHESLRTTFGSVDGRPVQRIAPPGELSLGVTDLSDLEPTARRTELERGTMDHAQQPFDLATGPLARVALFRLTEREHVLMVTVHHIIADGWSLSILSRELGALYAAFVREAPPPLPELPLQYADYAAWQRWSMDGPALESSLAFWRKVLMGAPTLELPTDRPRPVRQTFRGAGIPMKLAPELSAELQALTRRGGVTLFMTLLAALKALLVRHTGLEDVVVGAPVAGRTRAETESLIGFFLNTVALRDDLSGDPSFREILARVRGTVLEALAHQEAPFAKVVEALRPERDLSRTPLFQVFLNVLNFPRTPSPEGTELTISPLTRDLRSLALDLPAKFDLSLYAAELPDGIGLFLLYNADLFEATTAATLMRHLEAVLTAAARAPDTRLSALPLVSEAERAAPAIRPERAFVEFPAAEQAGTIPDRFRSIVDRHGDRVAVESKGTAWTYRELAARAGRVAGAVERVVGRNGGRVGLLLSHEAPMVAAVLGVLDSGNAYVPLDPLYPRERLAFMLADAETGVLVTDTERLKLARALAGDAIGIVNVDELEPGDAPRGDEAVAPAATAYILYTSGSTGQPKGVMQSHRNVLHHIGAYTNNLHIGPEDRLALVASFSFDAAVMDIFGALLNGATLCLRDVREHGVEGLGEWLDREGITIYHSTPTLYRALLAGLAAEQTFAAVRLVVLGGEEVVRRDVELYRRHFSADCLFVNGLGPTESTVSFQHFIDHRTPLVGVSVPVGFAVADTELVLLDAEGRPATLTGEIGIRSRYVALGYWRRPELTAAAFLVDPEGGGRRIYRTGDLGRLRPDGTLEFLGRRDDQVKVRGFRIEPAEVEAVLDAHPGVRRSVVVAAGDSGERFLAGYVVPREEPGPETAALQSYLRERLPAYMVPSVIVRLEALPLTPSGKVDRRVLPAPGRPEPARAGVLPRTPLEETISGIWREVLGVETIGVEDDFFALGGHSLMATRVLSRLRARLHADVPLRALFEAPTIAALAALVEVQQTAPAAEDAREEIEL